MAVGSIRGRRRSKAGGIPRVSTRLSVSAEDERADAGRDGPFRETEF